MASRAPTTLTALPRSLATRRVNRIVLALLGLALTALGVLAVLTGLGIFGPGLASGPVLVPAMSRFAADNGWFWPVVAVAGVVLAVLAVRWLTAQLRTNATRNIDVEADRSHGETVLDPSAVTAAAAAEVASYMGVDSADAALRDHHGATLLVIRARLDGRVPVAEVREAIETRAVPHTRQVLDAPDLAARVEITISPRRVRLTG